ncbi:hypothetical protein [Janibacter melonis]|uniref:hypothetical protein n=1 Tax=Janibacter melonis TaxID=262209 RepID=UPI0027DAA743|nr:hypothetical protein [Janibacter melonis]
MSCERPATPDQVSRPAPSERTVHLMRTGRRQRRVRRAAVVTALAVLVLLALVLSLCLGQTTYSPGEVLRVVLGESVPGASFAVGELRLPAPASPWSSG